MDQTFLNGLLADVNSAEEPVFTWGFPGVSSAGCAARLAAKSALDPAMVERALSLLCGELGGLVLDRDLYRREFPVERDEACSLRLESETPEDAPEYRSFTALFTARSPLRDRALKTVAKLLGKLPPVWVSVSSKRLNAPVVFASVACGKSSIGKKIGNGKELFYAEAELRIRVCTALPRGI